MEANTPYALYDNDGKRAMQWAAHIRLTPELLLKLQQNPEQVLLTLNANISGDGGAARKSTKKTSLLSVSMGARASAAGDDGSESESSGQVARYELHSFKEDPRVNYLAAFRQNAAQPQVPVADQSGGEADANDTHNSSKGCGYSVYTTGKIYQKLIVQRMLDSTEKDRMKDRHAQSVIESRSRASKLLEDHPPATSKRKRVSLFSTQFAKPDVKNVLADIPLRKRILPSALSAEAAQKTKERIQKGFEKKIIPQHSVVPAASATAVEESPPNQQGTTKTNAKAAKVKGKQAAQASLFSSDSENEGGDDEEEEDAKKQEEPNGEAADQATVKSFTKNKTSNGTKGIEDTPDAAITIPLTATPSGSTEDSTLSTNQSAAQKQPPKPRKPPVVSETKRPLPRASRIPDLSFFPCEVGLICKKTSAHITRTVVLDEEDYDTFVQQYASFKADWETLDKVGLARCFAGPRTGWAYSIEMINVEGLHVRMKFIADDQERAELEREQQENARKKEALLFVRDAMASIQKILSSIQVSIARYDRKQAQ